jgi:hypothetical protein
VIPQAKPQLTRATLVRQAVPKISFPQANTLWGATPKILGITNPQSPNNYGVIGPLCPLGGPAEQLGINWDWEVVEIEQAADCPPKELFYIPALLLVACIYLLQIRRKARF